MDCQKSISSISWLLLAVVLTACLLQGFAPMTADASPGVIYACVNRQNGNVRIVGTNVGCKKNETPINWNVTGSPGPTGPPGDAGANVTFGRLALEGGPPAGADTPMTTILSLNGFGDVLMYCYTAAGPTTDGGFAFRNTTSEPVVLSGFGALQPGQRTGGGQGSMNGAGMFQVTSEFDHPDRIATVIVSGIVEGNVCRGHAQAIAQP